MKRLLVSLVIAAFVAPALPAFAQTQTGTEFYMAYRAAWAKAKSFQDIVSFHSKASQAELAKIPPDEQKMMFEMVREMDVKDVKIVKETATATGATLEATGIDPDGAKATGTIELVKEDGAWKLVKERWKM